LLSVMRSRAERANKPHHGWRAAVAKHIPDSSPVIYMKP
jgi:hypothetical protein